MRKFLYADNGAVSVYLILIIVPIFLFQAVLIDFARIKLAENEAESAVQAGARSVMSSFDSDLQKWGLYGMNLSQEESEKLFSNVFNGNLSGGISSNAFHFVDTSAVKDAARVTPVYSLASHVIFEKQLVQDMKIKAPIEFTLEIVDKFQKSGVKEPFQLGSKFAKEASEVEKLIKQREDALDEAWDSTDDMHTQLTSFHGYYLTKIAELDKLAGRIGIHTMDEVRQEIDQTMESLQTLDDTISSLELTLESLRKTAKESVESIKSLTAEKSALEQHASEMSQKLNDLQSLIQDMLAYTALLVSTKVKAAVDVKEITHIQQEIEPAIRIAKQKNDEIRMRISSPSSSNGSGMDTSGSQNANDVFKQVSLIGDDYFYTYQTSVASVTALFSAFQAALDSVTLYTTENTKRVNQTNEAYWSSASTFYTKQSALEKARMDANEAKESNKKAQTSMIQSVLDKAKQVIGGCDITNDKSGDAERYAKLQGTNGYYQKYQQANVQDTSTGNNVAYELDKAESTSLKSMDMLGAISQVAESLRTELYVNEYALSKFNYRTYGLTKSPSGDPKISHELIDPSTHGLVNQEVEYLLYGFSTCAANMSSAYAEMFSIRMAIRTVEALLDPKKEVLNIGSPMLVLLVAAAQGAVEALVDMNALVKGEAVELSAKLSTAVLKLTYKDYLRLFLLLHSNNAKLMARMQALLELEMGKDLRQESTYIQTNATSQIRLWFIPQMMKLLDGTGLLGCKVVGSHCQFNQTAVVSY